MADEKGKKSFAGRNLKPITPEEAERLRQLRRENELKEQAEKLANNESEELQLSSERVDVQHKQWYVLRAIGGKEKKVKEYIDNEISHSDLKDYVSQVLIPTEKVVQLRGGKKINKDRNYFPGYILIEAVLVGETAHILRNITNVIGFLGDEKNGSPIPLRESEVNRILGKVDELAETTESLESPFLVGDSVRVIEGPFNSFTGIIEEINTEKKKLKVTVKIFGRKTPVELGFSQVEKE